MAATYTYNAESPGPVDFVRLMIPDTQFLPNVSPPQMIFSDQEIEMFYRIQGSVFQSTQFYSGAAGRFIPSTPLSYLRVAALALDTLANNKGKLGNVIQLLDVKLDWSKAAQILRDGAKNYRDIDDDSGAIFIIEQTNTDWSFRDRWWKQWQRQSAGAGLIGG